MRISLPHAVLDLDAHLLTPDTPLTKIEVALLQYLAERPGQVVTRAALLEDVWGYKRTTRTRAVANAVARLRRKIELDAQNPRHLLTVHGVGYRLEGWQRADAPVVDAPPRACFPERVAELDWLTSRLADASGALMLISGPGGIGKSHLVRAALAALDWTDRMVWCDVTGLDSELALLRRAASVLGVRAPESSGAAVLRARLGLALASRDRPVVIFDGLQHPALGADLLSVLHRMASGAHVIATSRIAAGWAGESLSLGPLSPAAGSALYRTVLVEHGGVLREGDAAVIDRLVAALDGLPLALILAASWGGVLTPAQTLARLDDRFTLLRSRSPDAPAHQRTLWQTLADSWSLLDSDVQDTLAGCSIFCGGFEAGAAEAVLGGAVLEHLEDLRDHALLHSQSESSTGPMRYILPRSVQEFAARQLAEAGRTRTLYAAHAAHYLARGQAIEASMGTGEDLAALQRDHENLLAIVTRHAADSPDTAIRAALLLWYLRHSTGQAIEAEIILATAEQVTDPSLRSRALAVRGRCRRSAGDRERAQVDLSAAEALAAQVGSPGDMGFIALTRCRVFIQDRQLAEAWSSGLAAQQHLEEAGDWRGRFMATERLARIAHLRGDLSEAAALFRQAMRGFERVGTVRSAAAARSNLGHLLRDQDRLEEAAECYEAVITTCNGLGAHLDADSNRVDLANIWMLEGRYERAKEAYARLSEAHLRRGHLRGAAIAQTNCGIAWVLLDNLEAGGDCLARAQAQAEAASMPDLVALAWGMRGYVAHREGRWGSAKGGYEDSIRSCASPRMDQTAGVFSVYLSLLHTEAGDHPSAAAALQTARERFGPAPDAEARALLAMASGEPKHTVAGSWSVRLAEVLQVSPRS